jgi:hypothetical protein
LPRRQGVVKKNELLTSAAKWFRQQCDAEDEESDAFRDLVVCGMGWTETRLDYEDNREGDPKVDRVDPLEMVWDSGAKKRNLVDNRRLAHIRRNVPIDEARALCPGDTDRPFEDADYNASWIGEEGENEKPHHNDGETYNKEERGEDDDGDKCVTLVRVQWWERVPAYLVLDPTNPENILTLGQDEFKALNEKAKLAGGSLRFTKTTRKIYRQAYLGNVLLEVGDAPCKGHFSFKCMTGKARPRISGCPRRCTFMNTTPKDRIAVPRGQFFDDDDAQGEAWWAPESGIPAKTGALSSWLIRKIPRPTRLFRADATPSSRTAKCPA